MSKSHAHNFFDELDTDSDVRKACFSCRTKESLFATLKEHGYDFTPDEFDQEITLRLFKCQTEDQFNKVRQKEMWFKMYS